MDGSMHCAYKWNINVWITAEYFGKHILKLLVSGAIYPDACRTRHVDAQWKLWIGKLSIQNS
jgi:hypothetical protein